MINTIHKMRQMYPLSDETVQLLCSYTRQCHIPKKTQLIKEGIYCKVAYFLEKGMTRSFWLVDGKEVTTSFSGQGDIVFSMDELYYNKLSEEFVETIDETEAYEISLSDLSHLWRTNIELSNWGRIIHQNEYRRLHRNHKELLTLSARERYELMKTTFPEVCEQANLGYIASYLGVTLPTLSRIRSSR